MRRISFADHMKADLSDVRGLTGGGKEPLRPLYQTYAEIAKKLHGQNYWIDRLKYFLEHCQHEPGDTYILTDVRYPYEANWVRDQGGLVVLVERPGRLPDPATSAHPSEMAWKEIDPDHRIANASTMGAYAARVIEAWSLYEQGRINEERAEL